MKKILLSLGVLVVAGALVAGGTGAFFSDEETSTGNTFTAGEIDLKIDNTSYYNGEFNEGTSCELVDLTIEKFFDFGDLKPGDWGEDTISLHVGSNDSWVCADVTLTSDDDNGITEPEGEDGDVTDGAGNGELADAVDFLWWADDGDNVLETCPERGDQSGCVEETVLPGGPLGALAVGQSATVAFADANSNIWGGQGALPGETTVYVGKAWCFGDIAPAPLPQDGQGADSDRTPANSTGGITCSGGADENNVTQTDSLTADISFRAVQSRHNADFLCTRGNGTELPE